MTNNWSDYDQLQNLLAHKFSKLGQLSITK